jgi:phosphoserine phosphatase RsbU/P
MATAMSAATISRNHRRARPIPQYAALAFLFAASVAYQTAISVEIVRRLHVSVPYFALKDASNEIDVVTPVAAAAGLKRGDHLLTVNGRPYTGVAVLAQEEAQSQPGSDLILTIRQAGEAGERQIQVPITSTQGRKLGQTAVVVLLLIVTPWFCLLLVSWVVLVRPRDRLAWLLWGMLIGFTQLFGAGRTTQAWPAGFAELATIYHVGLIAAWPIFMFLFGFYFPVPFPERHRVARWSRIFGWVVLAPLILSGVVGTFVSAMEIRNYELVEPIARVADHLDLIFQILSYVAVGAFFAFIATKSSEASLLPADSRRRLRLLYWGATVAMTPTLLFSIYAALRHVAFEVLPQWLTYPGLVLLLLFPLALAYVIVVQRAMDVRVVIRQGLQYGLTTTGIRIVRILITALIVIAAVNLAQRHGSGLMRDAVLSVIVIGLLLTIRQGADRLRTWTDRRFFREAYNAEQVLSELSDHVRSMVETKSLLETVTTRIADTLHIHNVAVLLGGSEAYHPAYALGYASTPDVTFPSNVGTIKVLEAQREPARIYLDDPDSWLYRNPEVSEEERAKLAQLHAELLLPLNARDKLLGFISLGPKRSDEPYSGADVRLLKSVAAQTGLALENARLMSAIAEEVAHRERLNREVEIAREVQERLFPQTLPPICGLEYAGTCRPALGVGGDYYDFLALPGGQLGIAIGDVSGKGIAAALMMASLQASLRGEATRAPENLAALVSNVNRLVYEASSSNRYATFFYAQYNPEAHQLIYVNAGHNPPMLFHCANGAWQVSRLETGGTVVGLMQNFCYDQGLVTMSPGDVLVAFTDGISEAMNHEDEEWGEERLQETVKCCADLSPAEMITRIMQCADSFVAGAKQHDDMTLVVLRSA